MTPAEATTTTINVLLFGPLAQRAGARRVAVPISAANPIPRDVLAALARACPAIADALPGCRLAVNHAFADGDDAPPIQSGDEVALIGMVSGG